jgi:hypothetical protein
MKQIITAGLLAAFALSAAVAAPAGPEVKVSGKKDEVFRIPYRLAPTNHTVVRVKINGKGPFHFIVDTGAPAIFIDPKIAKQCGVDEPKDGWAVVKQIEIEGGVVIDNCRAHIHELYQTAGMNALFPEKGRELVGVLGYNILARFKLDFDYTRPYMLWTRLDFEPPRPKGALEIAGADAAKQEGFEGNMGNMAKLLAGIFGNRPPLPSPKAGYLGIELDPIASPVKITVVHKGSPAEAAGIKVGDVLLAINGNAIRTTEDVIKQSANILEGTNVELTIQRKSAAQTLTVKAASGL